MTIHLDANLHLPQALCLRWHDGCVYGNGVIQFHRFHYYIEKILRQQHMTKRRGKPTWCPGRDLNPHASRRHPLKMVRLPVPPPGQEKNQDRFVLVRKARVELACPFERHVLSVVCLPFPPLPQIDLVPGPGVEPGRLSALDFESSASTVSASLASSCCQDAWVYASWAQAETS